MSKKVISTISVAFLVTACSTLPEHPNQIGKEALLKYESLSKLIDSSFQGKSYIAYNDTSFLDLARPYEYVKAYCEAHNGDLNQVYIPYAQKDIKMPRVALTLPDESELVVLNEIFGDFECVIDEELSWAAEIRHSGAIKSDFERVYGTYFTVKEYPFKQIESAGSKNIDSLLPQYLVGHVDEYNRAKSSDDLRNFIEKNSNHSDPLGYVLSAHLKIPLVVEYEKMMQKQAQEKELQRVKKLTAKIELFRKTIDVGDSSHCGLIVEVNRPVVKAQTSNGTQWIKLSELYPAGVTDQWH